MKLTITILALALPLVSAQTSTHGLIKGTATSNVTIKVAYLPEWSDGFDPENKEEGNEPTVTSQSSDVVPSLTSVFEKPTSEPNWPSEEEDEEDLEQEDSLIDDDITEEEQEEEQEEGLEQEEEQEDSNEDEEGQITPYDPSIDDDITDGNNPEDWSIGLPKPSRLPIPTQTTIYSTKESTTSSLSNTTDPATKSTFTRPEPTIPTLPTDLPESHSDPFQLISLTPSQRSLHGLPLIISESQVYLQTTHMAVYMTFVGVMLDDGSVRVLEGYENLFEAPQLLLNSSVTEEEDLLETGEIEHEIAIYLTINEAGFFGISTEPMYGFKIRSGYLIFQDSVEFGIDRSLNNDDFCFAVKYFDSLQDVTGDEVCEVYLGVKKLDVYEEEEDGRIGFVDDFN
ncbi:hypothetical protein WICPIJ_007550 [Wickerhamomyces pijperi]|uniref:Uncharacterized protein n=1 Tax=Wickerhamomyces pijperi TaxID=599730 RepID=A0A9P8TKB4_WICPI|nr:hypothetical protein WICPIJ_007550 [Wickerhamomyces pijperi]